MGIIFYIYRNLSYLLTPLLPLERKLPRVSSSGKKNCIWFHSASLGEVLSITPLIEKFLAKNYSCIMTVNTKSGMKRATTLFGEKLRIFLFPYDNPVFLKKIFINFTPSVLILTEAEFWPNLLYSAIKNKIKIFHINSRISRRTLLIYRSFGNPFFYLISRIKNFFVQSEENKKRFLQLGIKEENIEIAGNLKYDALDDFASPIIDREKLRGNFVLTFGSLRRKEIKKLGKVLPLVFQKNKNLFVIVVPRHLINVHLIIKQLNRAGLKFSLRSKNTPSSEEKIWIIDTFGELQRVWKITDIAVVGGTFFNYGGHNLAEPAIFQCPVLFGNDTRTVKDFAEIILKKKGGIRLKDMEQIPEVVSELIRDPVKLMKMGKNARESVLSMKGSLELVFEKILRGIGG